MEGTVPEGPDLQDDPSTPMLDELMETTWTRADLHLHSSYSFDVPDLPALRPRALFEKALGEAGMDWFTLTDHDTLAGWEALVSELGEGDRARVIPGVEHTLRDPGLGFTLHVNIYGIDPDRYAELNRRVGDLDELLAFCDAHGLRCQYNHPTWWDRRELRRGTVDFDLVPRVASRFPVLELNAARTAAQNMITASLARKLDLPLIASSDSHTGEVGRAWTEAPAGTAETFLDLAWNGQARTFLRHLSYRDLVTEAHALIDEIVDRGEDLAGSRTASSAGQTMLETAAARIVQARVVREHPAMRESLRSLLKHVSRPIMGVVMELERRLENRLAGSSLGVYMSDARDETAA